MPQYMLRMVEQYVKVISVKGCRKSSSKRNEIFPPCKAKKRSITTFIRTVQCVMSLLRWWNLSKGILWFTWWSSWEEQFSQNDVWPDWQIRDGLMVFKVIKFKVMIFKTSFDIFYIVGKMPVEKEKYLGYQSKKVFSFWRTQIMWKNRVYFHTVLGCISSELFTKDKSIY